MCGVTANNQEGDYQVNDLQLKDNKRAAFVSILGWHFIGYRLKLEYPLNATYNEAVKSAEKESGRKECSLCRMTRDEISEQIFAWIRKRREKYMKEESLGDVEKNVRFWMISRGRACVLVDGKWVDRRWSEVWFYFVEQKKFARKSKNSTVKHFLKLLAFYVAK